MIYITTWVTNGSMHQHITLILYLNTNTYMRTFLTIFSLYVYLVTPGVFKFDTLHIQLHSFCDILVNLGQKTLEEKHLL